MLVWLIIALLVLAPALYIVAWNTDTITVYLTPGVQFSGNTGIVIITIFVLGILFATLFAIFFAVKGYLRERELKNRDARREAFYKSLLRARSYLAAEEWEKARLEWEQILKKDPNNVLARIELSRSLEGAGNLRDALKVVDAARASDPNNTETLFRAAELNLALQNKTAAIDNLALILYHAPGKKAAVLAQRLSEELERLEDAVEYQEQLSKLGVDGTNTLARLNFKRILRDNAEDKVKLVTELKAFLKRSGDYVPALHKLSQLEAEAGYTENAAQLLMKAARASGSSQFRREAATLWIENNQPDKAVSAIKTAVKEASGTDRIDAELDLARLYIKLDLLDEARGILDNLFPAAKASEIVISEEQKTSYYALQSLCLNRMGKSQESALSLKKLIDKGEELEVKHSSVNSSADKTGVSPSLSTP